MTVYPLSAIRALALHATGLDVPNLGQESSGIDQIYQMIDQLGAVQIDTLQMVARAQYLTLWSRLGNYEPENFDRLANDGDSRRIFEGWFHAACFVPLSEYRYQMPMHRARRENGQSGLGWIGEPGHQELMQQILDDIRKKGGLRASNIEGGKQKGGTWWNWRPEKMALEQLFLSGEVMISRRVNFQRVYELTNRVLPAWVEKQEPTEVEHDRFWLLRGARALGVFLPRNSADYTWMKITRARPLIAEMLRTNELLEVEGETLQGVKTLLIHPDNLPKLQAAADGALKCERTTFLNPFDNLWWAKGRDEAFWGFRQRLEAYYPAEKRIFGYYCLPILHRGRLIGRFDPKLERKNHLLRIKSVFIEPNVDIDGELIRDVATAMVDFMKFHHATALVIEKSFPQEFGDKLSAAII